MSDIIQLLRDLLASGQFGIIIIGLIAIIGGAVWLIWLQRQTMARVETLMKAIELNMKAADTVREQSGLAQNELKDGLQKQFDTVIKANEELRKELERIKSDQARFEHDVKKALNVGLNELKTSLSRTTVSEMIGQVPENFRQDLERELNQAANRAYQDLAERLRTANLEIGDSTAIIERSVRQAFEGFLNSDSFRRFMQELERDMQVHIDRVCHELRYHIEHHRHRSIF